MERDEFMQNRNVRAIISRNLTIIVSATSATRDCACSKVSGRVRLRMHNESARRVEGARAINRTPHPMSISSVPQIAARVAALPRQTFHAAITQIPDTISCNLSDAEHSEVFRAFLFLTLDSASIRKNRWHPVQAHLFCLLVYKRFPAAIARPQSLHIASQLHRVQAAKRNDTINCVALIETRAVSNRHVKGVYQT